MYKPLKSRQVVNRAVLQQLFPYIGSQTLDVLLASINSDLTPSLSVNATSSPSLVVNIGAGTISNPESTRNRTLPFINAVLPTFAGGTVTIPSTSGGTITASTGATLSLSVPSNNYINLLLMLDSSGNIQMELGSPNPTASLATVPSPISNTMPFAYVTIFNNAGTIANIVQSSIFQIPESTVSASSGGTSTGWIAKKVSLSLGATQSSISFTATQPDLAYVAFAMMGNVTDTNPQFQPVIVTNKTVNGFTASWNMPLDTSNYFIYYIVPPKEFSLIETSVNSGLNTLTDTLPIPQNGSNYGFVAALQNTVDLNPQFQSVVISGKSSTAAVVLWSANTATANYKVSAMVNATKQSSISGSATSVTVGLPVDFGSTSYALFATLVNVTDANPQLQPLLVTASNNGNFTVSWNVPTDSSNYLIMCYALSLTT